MPKILITGANGFLGRYLKEILLENADLQLVTTAREGVDSIENRVASYRMDICNEAEVNRIFDLEKPDFVIHGAAMTQVDACEQDKRKCWKVNVGGTKTVLNAARRHQAFFVQISTDFIFDGEDGPYKEGDLPDPVNYYGLSKLAGELLVEGSGLSYTILRTVLIYGWPIASNKSNIVLWVKRSLEEGKEIRVVNDQWRTPTLVQDLAASCRLVIEAVLSGRKVSGVYHISGKDFLTPYQLALEVADFFNLDKSLIKEADISTFSQPARRPPRTGFVVDRAMEELNFQPHSFREGLQLIKSNLPSAH